MSLLSAGIAVVWLLVLVRTALNLAMVPRIRAPESGRRNDHLPPSGPFVSLVVPARDEERAIEATVRALLAQDWPWMEVIAVNDRSTDGTGAVLRQLQAEDERLIVVDTAEPPQGWLGKPWALHQGSLRAKGELLLFVDADVWYAPTAVSMAVGHLLRRNVPFITLMPRFEMRGFWEHVLMPNLGFFLFSFFPLWWSNGTRIPLLAVGGGTGNLVRREAYDKAGGHEALRGAVVDDVGLARLIRSHGGRTEVVLADTLIKVHMYDGLADTVRGFTKNAFAVTNRSYVMSLLFVVFGFLFHILPFGLALGGDWISVVTVALILATRLLLYSVLRYGLVNALLAHPLMIAGWLFIMIRSTWITGVRQRLEWRGRTYDAKKTRFGAE